MDANGAQPNGITHSKGQCGFRIADVHNTGHAVADHFEAMYAKDTEDNNQTQHGHKTQANDIGQTTLLQQHIVTFVSGLLSVYFHAYCKFEGIMSSTPISCTSLRTNYTSDNQYLTIKQAILD